jgi:hypothetical protein
MTGRWTYEDNGEIAELTLDHDKASGNLKGSFAAFGEKAAITGRAQGSGLTIDQLGGVATSAEKGTIIGAVSGEEMLLTITQPGNNPVILRLTRQPGSGGQLNTPSATGSAATAADNEDSFSPASLDDFAGSWEAVSDDGTKTETAEFEIANGAATGTLKSLERGYYSGRVTVTAEVAFRATPSGGALDLVAWPVQNGSTETGVKGRAMRRGEYLVVRVGDGETSYARPGTSLIKSAEGSTDAVRLVNAVAGRVYSSSSQASGRGASVGGRMRLALCSDQTIAFDASDLATTGGPDAVDMGDATSRRGTWSVVLLAGMPVVRAKWNGTGSTYSLTRYFRIRPSADGSSARIDATNLPVTGSC